MSGVSCEGDGRAGAHNLLLSLQFHHLVADLDFGDSTITSTDEKVTVGQQLHAVDTLGEESVAGSDALEESALKVDLNDITSESSHVGARIVWGDDNALVDSLDLAHSEVLEQDFLLSVVDVPDADAIVVDGHHLLSGVVEEGDFVGDVHANGVSTDCLSTISLI